MTNDVPRTTDTFSPTVGGPRDQTRERIPVAEVRRLLANNRRRAILTHLTTRSAGTVLVEDLVEFVAERESPQPGPGTHRDRIAADLHHVHIPLLADAEVVRFDPVAGTVRYLESERVEQLLSIDENSGKL